MYCYVIAAHGRDIAYKKIPGDPPFTSTEAFEHPTNTGPANRCGIDFRRAFQAHISLANPDWAGVDAVTADHMAEPYQEKLFDEAFGQRVNRSVGIEDFIYWLIPAVAPARLSSGRAAYRIV